MYDSVLNICRQYIMCRFPKDDSVSKWSSTAIHIFFRYSNYFPVHQLPPGHDLRVTNSSFRASLFSRMSVMCMILPQLILRVCGANVRNRTTMIDEQHLFSSGRDPLVVASTLNLSKKVENNLSFGLKFLSFEQERYNRSGSDCEFRKPRLD